MDNDEIRRIRDHLRTSRPWVEPTAEEKEAREIASRLLETVAPLKASEEFNARVHDELAGIPVPPTLRDQIAARRKIVKVPFWRQPRLLGAVAVLALLLFGTFNYLVVRKPGEDLSLSGFRQRMVSFALREYRMDLFTSDLDELRRFLAVGGTPHEFLLPNGLQKIPVKGGARLSWQGKPVSMVCFESAGKTFYMFVLEDEVLAADLKGSPHVAEIKKLATASWTSGDDLFLLAAPVQPEQLRALL